MPVAYETTLDTAGGRDMYAYASERLVYSSKGSSLEKSVLKEIDNFYQDKEWQKKRDSWISSVPGAVTIQEALGKLEKGL